MHLSLTGDKAFLQPFGAQLGATSINT